MSGSIFGWPILNSHQQINQGWIIQPLDSYISISKMQNSQIKQFISNSISQLDKKYSEESNPMQALKLATKRVAFSNILYQYFGESNQVVHSLIQQIKTYLIVECYTEAESQARLAKKKNIDFEGNHQAQISLLMAKAMMKQGKLSDSLEILQTLTHRFQSNYHEEIGMREMEKQYYELMIEILIKLNQQQRVIESLNKLQNTIVKYFGNQGEEYAFLLVKKGQVQSHFGRIEAAIQKMNSGIQLLIQSKCKQKERVMKVYLAIAQNYRKIQNLTKEYSSLICAQAMAKQLLSPEKLTLQTAYLIAKNLKDREQYQKSLNQYEKIKEIQKNIFGESSIQLGKTLKKIAEILVFLNRKGESKIYELQYSRILGEPRQSRILQPKNFCQP